VSQGRLLLESEYLRRLGRYRRLDRTLAQKYAMTYEEFLERRVVEREGYILSVSGRYSYHWDRRLTSDGDLYRHDNAPPQRWCGVATYPKHFHQGSEGNVMDSHISDDPEVAIREFLAFVRYTLLSRS